MDKKLYKMLLEEPLKLKEKTIIMTTHDIQDGLDNFDEVIFMDNREIIEKGEFSKLCDTENFVRLTK
ncbi:hypothetical protein IAI10_23625 [Clostridium sp. 19966]|uniref:hypothetical protein n=1 Tax=Clostridium sp. 19966 TaxID=2768166 RepID=UPI0028DDB7F2|nr:hypothetical protein [Clostridium sp. 19966]MDT8719636.1 hypothetical protein [Clostridium sp. 19966]